MSLRDHGEDLAYDAAFWLQGIENSDYPIGELGAVSLDVSSKFRALAIITLLVEGEPDLFHHNLIRSGRARQLYLERLKRTGVERDHYQASGRYGPLLDVVAADDFDRAREIVLLSPQDMLVESEYEDDYCYAQVIHRFIQETDTEVAELLEQLEAYLDGDQSARLQVCRALLTCQQADFDDAFDSLLIEHEIEIEQARDRGQFEDILVLANREVFIEALAILRLASLRGLDTQEEYRFCPSVARLPMKMPFPGE